MKKRLLWNFEMDTNAPLDWETFHDEKEETRWEQRYFFKESCIISLFGLTKDFLNLSRATIEHKEDHYLLIPNQGYNLKYRDTELLYKPQLSSSTPILGYGKKINLKSWPASTILPGEDAILAEQLLHEIDKQSQTVTVVKEAVIYKLPTKPKIKLELSRLIIKNSVYFSVCIEGRSYNLVEKISKLLMPGHVSCDYVSFLGNLLK